MDQALVIVTAQHGQSVSRGNTQALIGIAGQGGTLERIGKADPEIAVIIRRHLGVGAGHTDGGHAGLLKDLAAGHGHTGTIGAQHNGHVPVHQFGRRCGAVLGRGAVIHNLQLNIVSLAADFHCGLHIVGILHTQDLLLTAGAVITGLGLVNANANHLVAGLTGLIRGPAALSAAAGKQGRRHHQTQCKSSQLFHSSILLSFTGRPGRPLHVKHFTCFSPALQGKTFTEKSAAVKRFPSLLFLRDKHIVSHAKTTCGFFAYFNEYTFSSEGQMFLCNLPNRTLKIHPAPLVCAKNTPPVYPAQTACSLFIIYSEGSCFSAGRSVGCSAFWASGWSNTATNSSRSMVSCCSR